MRGYRIVAVQVCLRHTVLIRFDLPASELAGYFQLSLRDTVDSRFRA